MKKVLPIALGVLVFIIAFALMRPAPTSTVVVAARALTAGHAITADDVTTVKLPQSYVPADAITDPATLVGLTLAVDRSVGDLILMSHTGDPITLQPNERAIAVDVADASGLAGLLRPGDLVGVNAVIFSQGTGQQAGAYSKATVEGLRVLYISPEFEATDPMSGDMLATQSPGLAAYQTTDERSNTGVVVLAVPIDNQVLVYDFTQVDPSVQNQTRTVNAVELLSALTSSDNAELSLYLMPENPQTMVSSGLWLPDLMIMRQTATPTPIVGSSVTYPATNPSTNP